MSPRKKNKKQRNQRRRSPQGGRPRKKKPCYFCQEKVTYVDFKDVALLRKYMSDRAKIRSSRVTGNCPQHQRMVATAIKNAREMALLPYIAR
jgi:small subunit ribosomal protein S18